MRTFGQRWVMAAMVVAGAAVARPAGAQNAAISLDIQDYSGSSASLLREVRTDVGEILQHAGVKLMSEDAPRYTVKILTADMARRMGHPSERMGFFPGGHIVYVLDEHIGTAVVRSPIEKAGLLAAVIAHELGHALLPPHAHAPNGIMRPEWDDKDLLLAAQGGLHFLAYQAKQLRDALIADTTMASVN